MTTFTFEAENTKELQPGDILLVRGTAQLSRAIEDFTQSPYSHAAIVMPAWGKYDMVFQAWAFGIEIVPLHQAFSEFTSPVDVYRLVDPANLQVDDLLAAALALVGRKYDYFGVIRLAWLILTGQRKRAPSRRSSRLFCSDYVQRVYRVGGVELTSFNDSVVEPGDLARCSKLALVSKNWRPGR